MRTRSFADLQQLALDGLKRHWSRSVATRDGPYAVSINPIHSTHEAMDDLSLGYNTNRDFRRSSNPGSVRGIYSFFGNVVPERVVYNVGWIKYPVSGWADTTPASEDPEFRFTAAHEVGHEILSAYGGDGYSYSHRGSSTVITQSLKPLGSGGQGYPSNGPIDLMKYYHGLRPPGFLARLQASEQDVLSLIWLSRVKFDA